MCVCVTGFALMLWIKEDLQQPEHRQPDDNGRPKTQQLLSTTANGLKRIILRSQPEIQVKIKTKKKTFGCFYITKMIDRYLFTELNLKQKCTVGFCDAGGRFTGAGRLAAEMSPADGRPSDDDRLDGAARFGRIDVRRPLRQPSAVIGVSYYTFQFVRDSVMMLFSFFFFLLGLDRFALRCLHHLSRCPPFFQHRCVILGVEPLLRVIPLTQVISVYDYL